MPYVPKSVFTAIKKELRTAKSNTKTKTKTKTRLLWSNKVDGIKHLTVNTKYKPTKISKLTKELSQPGQIYSYVNGGNLSGQGLQNQALITQTQSADLKLLFQGLNNGVAMTAPRSSWKLNFIGSKEEIEFMNCSPTTIEVDIYTLVDKVSGGGTDPGTQWSLAVDQEENDTSLPAESIQTIWSRPTNYKGFNTHYWTKRYPVVLTSGEKCKFTWNFKRNRVLDTSHIENFTSVRGITHKIMIVQKGTMIDGNNDFVIGTNMQSISKTKLVWIRKQTLYGSLLAVRPRIKKQLGANLPTLMSEEWHIDEDNGEPENAAIVTEFA